jgi:putative FmdB family regulatory protein
VVLVRDAGGWMPIYKYKCENGHVFDVMQKLFDAPLASCIECSAPVRKVMQPVNISFKGSGFYSTDYRGGTKAETTTKNGESGDKVDDKGTEKKSSSSEKVSANV